MTDRVYRAFALKKNRQSASEARRQAKTTSTYLSNEKQAEPLPKTLSRTSLNSYASGIVPLTDVVDPPDFEEVVQLQKCQDQDRCSALVDFPQDDVDVSLAPRPLRTLEPVTPDPGAVEKDPHVRDCLRGYTSDFHVYQRKYLHYSSSQNHKERCLQIQGTQKQLQKLDYEQDKVEESTPMQRSQKRSSLRFGPTVDSGQNWVSSSFNLDNSQADPLLPYLLDQVPPEEIDENNAISREEGRHSSLFSLFPLQSEDVVEKRLVSAVPSEHFGYRIMVKCLTLAFDLEIEPMFVTMALYDIKEKKKISENFYLDMNDAPLKNMLVDHIQQQDLSTLSRTCIFSISHPSPDIFLVVKLEKVLQQGDISDAVEPYTKDGKNVNKDKLKTQATQVCQRLGAYRMPFGWTAIHLMNVIDSANNLDPKESALLNPFDKDKDGGVGVGAGSASGTGGMAPGNTGSLDRRNLTNQVDSFRKSKREDSLTRSGSLDNRVKSGVDKRASFYVEEPVSPVCALDNFRPVTLTVPSLFKQEGEKLSDEDLYKFLADFKRPSANVLKKLKSFPVVMRLDISPAPEEVRYSLSPELYKIDPFPGKDINRPIKEIVEFPQTEVLVPYTTYRNLLYIYPKSLNFASRSNHTRNLTVKVQYLTSEDPRSAERIIFGKSSCPEYTTEAYTAVTYHNKTPCFYDEIKIRLPAVIPEGTHILFTFYHVSCQLQKKDTGQAAETVAGYTWLPVLKDGRLNLGNFNVPVASEKPASPYSVLTPDVQLPGMKWIDNHKSLFEVQFAAESSLHTQDPYIDHFFSVYHWAEEGRVPSRMSNSQTPVESELKKGVMGLAKAGHEPMVRFLPLILDTLLRLMVRPPVISQQANIPPTVFDTLAKLVKQLCSLQSDPNDPNGRNSLLAQYIQYYSSIVHPSKDANFLYDSYGGRPVSMPDFHGYEGDGSSRPISVHPSDTGSMSLRVPPSPSKPHHQSKIVHEEVALQWVVSSGTTRDNAMCNAWFFFELMVKSMAEHLELTGKILAPRKQRFPTQYTEDVLALIGIVTKEIVDSYITDSGYAKSLNASLAFFMYDVFSLMDRGFVFTLIQRYCRAVNDRLASLPDGSGLILLKADFMRVIGSHEHFVTLNLPFTPMVPGSSPSMGAGGSMSLYSMASAFGGPNGVGQTKPPTPTELSNDFRQQHYLVGIILSDLTTSLESNNTSVHLKLTGMVRNLLYQHDTDPRYESPEIRHRIASLYLPIVRIVVDALPQLWDPEADASTSASKAGDAEKGTARKHGGAGSAGTTTEVVDQTVARAIATSSVISSRMPDVQQGVKVGGKYRNILTREVTCNLLSCFAWVLKNMEQNTLVQYWEEFPNKTLCQILDVLYLCLSNFEYKGRKLKYVSQQTIKKSSDMKSKLEEVILGGGSARSELLTRRRQGSTSTLTAGSPGVAPSPIADARLRWRKDQTQWNKDLRETDKSKQFAEPDFTAAGHLSSEMAMIVLDTLELIIEIIQASDSLQNLLSGVLKCLLHCLALNQSSYTLQHAFATQRSLVTKNPELLFDENTEECADLCLYLLRHCSSSLAHTRSHASASLYMLMRQNFEIGNNFARVKMQVTMSLSRLAGQNEEFFNEDYLRSSLKTILTYAEQDLDLQQTTFPDQVKDLLYNLYTILSDTVKMNDIKEDPEMLIDLMYRIAKGYQNSPDLRLTWLKTMASSHSSRGNHCEAGECYVHCAGLVAEYMSMIEPKSYLPVGCVAFQEISINVLDESAVSDDVVSPDEEGICTGRPFTEAGLIALLEEAARCFNSAGMYELVNEVNKTLVPLLEANREYSRLMMLHRDLDKAFESIIVNEGRRIFGTYFRVGFYGALFDDLNGKEYIYKEPPITNLAEIALRLEHFYVLRFGESNVEIIKDSNHVEQSKLDPDMAYIQLTYVEPYFELYELMRRETHFEKNHNLRRFVYSTPFTQDGKAHGTLDKQYKRKTILTTAHPFPYVKTRIGVIDKEVLNLDPIEVAIEDVQKRNRELLTALSTTPTDRKMLQMVLQGCIGTTVNQGPLEVATVFLKGVAEGTVEPTRHHHKLRLCFKDFLKKTSDALKKNKEMIGRDQYEYQHELQKNYQALEERLNPLIWIARHPVPGGGPGPASPDSLSKKSKRGRLPVRRDSRKLTPTKSNS